MYTLYILTKTTLRTVNVNVLGRVTSALAGPVEPASRAAGCPFASSRFPDQ